MLTRLHSVVVEVADFESAVRDQSILLGSSPVPGVSGSADCPAGGVQRRARLQRSLFQLGNMALELRATGASEGIAGLRLAGHFGDRRAHV